MLNSEYEELKQRLIDIQTLIIKYRSNITKYKFIQIETQLNSTYTKICKIIDKNDLKG